MDRPQSSSVDSSMPNVVLVISRVHLAIGKQNSPKAEEAASNAVLATCVFIVLPLHMLHMHMPKCIVELYNTKTYPRVGVVSLP